jgi:hypothetical protein
MRTVSSLWVQLVALGPVFALAQCCGQGTFVRITFDGPPVIALDTAIIVTNYYESGMSFTPIDPNAPWAGFVRRNGGGHYGYYPDNGTAYLQADAQSTLKFNSWNGSVFDLVSVDLAEYSTVVPDAVTVHFVGYRQDGSTVATDFTTDGIIDGPGPLADFQTFYFGPEFSGLTRVEVPSEPWSLDNLVVVQGGVPEPGTGTLVVVGAGMLGLRLLRRKAGP